MKTPEAIECLRTKLQGSAHLAAGLPDGNCKLCDALDTLYAAAETGAGYALAASWETRSGCCRDCPVHDACRKAPASQAPFGLLMCSSATKYLDLWIEATRREVTP
jgi:hypothetical protein